MSEVHSAAHSSDVEKLYVSLIERMGSLGISNRYERHISRAFQDRNVDGLRCLDKFMTSNSPRIIFHILICQLVANWLGKKGVVFLTQEMLDAATRVYRGGLTEKGFEIKENKNLLAFMFMNMDRAEEVFSLIENHGIMDAFEIIAIIESPVSVVKPLLTGVL